MLPLQRFSEFIRENGLFALGQRVLLAVSAGKDSVLMAHLFNESRFPFGIAHCNFGLRGAESAADEAFVRALAGRLNVPFFHTEFSTTAYKTDNKLSIQMAARALRYAWLEQVRSENGYACVATAHHQSDATETVLLNLVRGTGLAGLHGILPKRELLIRPLLFLDGPEIAEIVAAEKIAFREDSSNAGMVYQRNRIRHDVIPALKALNPGLHQTFAENSRRFAQAEELVCREIEKARTALFITVGNLTTIDMAGLRRLHPFQLFLFGLFKVYGFSADVLQDLERSLGGHSGKTFRSKSHTLTIDRGRLVLTETQTAIADVLVPAAPALVRWGDRTFRCREAGPDAIPAGSSSTALLDASKLVYPIRIRSWATGDSFRPLGLRGSKKVSDVLVGMKIPLPLKNTIAVFENGNGEIVWVAGYRISDDYKIGSRTKKVAIFESDE